MEIFSRIDIYAKSVIFLYISCVFCLCSDPIVSVTLAKILRIDARMLWKETKAMKKLVWIQNIQEFF